MNAFPFSLSPGEPPHTLVLTALHLPIALWLGVGIAYVGGRWRGSDRRMDFIRFTGELFIYYVLIALGGGVLMAMSVGIFEAIGINMEPYLRSLDRAVRRRRRHRDRHLARGSEAERDREHGARADPDLHSPLRAAAPRVHRDDGVRRDGAIDVKREILILFDLLLVVVFGLLLYSASARDSDGASGSPGLDPADAGRDRPGGGCPGALGHRLSRISEFGFTPNRVAALGENIVLLANLGGSAILYAGFLRGRVAFSRLLRLADVLPLRPRRLGGGGRLALPPAVRIRLIDQALRIIEASERC